MPNWYDEVDKHYAGQRAIFLRMIGFSEGTVTINESDDGYNVIVGGSLFHDYSDHPRALVDLPRLGIKSTAAGRYQCLSRYYDHYKRQLGLPDFGKDSQDRIALQLIRECRALEDIDAGCIREAIVKCSSRWASFPGAGYGQYERDMDHLLDYFEAQGGEVGE